VRRDEIQGELVAACPSFGTSPEWEAFWSDYRDEEPPLYLLMPGLVCHLGGLLTGGKTSELPALFSLVERMVDEGDAYVATLAVVGFLEDLQNSNLHEGTRPADFEPFFEPHTAWWWEEVRLFWERRRVPIGSSGRPRPHGMRWPLGG
jgi:hypothetical protein